MNNILQIFLHNKKVYFWIASLLFLLLLLTRLTIFSPSYIFNVNTKSDVFLLKIPSELNHQKWRINQAIICSKNPLKLGDHEQEEVPLNICKNSRLHAYRFATSELTLELIGGTEILLEILEDNSLAMAIRPQTKSKAKLSFTDGNSDIILNSRTNILWPSDTAKELILPFTGDATLGRDINWATRGMLHEGNIKVYTSDSSSASKRMLVDQTELVLGDQVRLSGKSSIKKQNYPKGFVRYNSKIDKNALDIVVFGEAKWIRVERYGDNGYGFKPGIMARASKDPLLMAILSLFAVLIAIVSGLVEIFRKN